MMGMETAQKAESPSNGSTIADEGKLLIEMYKEISIEGHTILVRKSSIITKGSLIVGPQS